MNTELIVKCAWCGKVHTKDGQQVSIQPQTETRRVTHGICPKCNSEMLSQLNAIRPTTTAS